MSLMLLTITPPAEEPITLAEAKVHCHVDGSDEDSLLTGLIVAARELCELRARRAFVTQTLERHLECWPASTGIYVPKAPLVSVTSVKYIDSDSVEQTVSSSDYIVDIASQPGRVVLKRNVSWPSAELQVGGAVRVRYVAGYGAASAVPARYKQAIRLLVGHWYENREQVAINQGNLKTLPFAVDALLMVDRGSWF